jgi:hypothetical protein
MLKMKSLAYDHFAADMNMKLTMFLGKHHAMNVYRGVEV